MKVTRMLRADAPECLAASCKAIAKANRMQRCNLGGKKLASSKAQAQGHLRTIAFQGAHGVVDKDAMVASEDLTSPIASKVQWKQLNRRMRTWAKGILAEALDGVGTQRKASHVLACGAYTSQMDSTTGLLQGRNARWRQVLPCKRGGSAG